MLLLTLSSCAPSLKNLNDKERKDYPIYLNQAGKGVCEHVDFSCVVMPIDLYRELTD